MGRTDKELTEFAAEIARDAWRAMNQAEQDFESEISNLSLNDKVTARNECDIYLYVYASGSWIIDGAQYLTDHRNIVAAIPVMKMNGPAELAYLIEEEYDDEGCSE